MESRSCSSCGLTKPIGEFYVDRGKPAARCKACHRKAVTLWRSANPDKVSANNRLNQKRRRLRIAEYVRQQKDQPCADCGESYPHWVMHFHHVEGEKVFAISRRSWHPSIERLRTEIAKCILLCANCHALRHPPAVQEGLPGRATLRRDAGF